MVIEPHMKQGRQHKLISTIFLATSVTKKLDHNTLCTGFFCLAIIKGPPNDIYFIIEGPYDGYFTEKVSQAPIANIRLTDISE